MEVHQQPNSIADSLRGVQGAFESASQAALALREQGQHLAVCCEELGAIHQQSKQTWLAELAKTLEANRRTTEEIQDGNQEILGRLAGLNRLKEDVLAGRAADGKMVMDAAAEFAGAVQRDLEEFGRGLDGVERLAGKRCEELLRHVQGTAEFFTLLDRSQSEVHNGLSRLQSHFTDQVELRRQGKRSRHRTQAVQATEAGCRALQTGDLEQAEASFRAAHERLTSPATLFNLALVLTLTGNPGQAHDLLLDPALSQCDPVEAQALKSLRALQAKDYPLALREAQAGLHVRPDHPGLRSLAATAALATNSAAAAFQLLMEPDAVMLKHASGDTPFETDKAVAMFADSAAPSAIDPGADARLDSGNAAYVGGGA